jgi:hypothetical protein
LWQSRRGAGRQYAAANGVKGALLGLTAASLLGMPSQNAVVSFTFWTFAFWYLALAVPLEAQAVPVRPWRAALSWPFLVSLAAVHAVGTFAAGQAELRPPTRAARFGWDYTYGFYALERGADGEAFRWTQREGVSVVEVKGTVLHLKAWVYHPDASRRPVQIRVWVNSELAIDTELRDSSAITREVPVQATVDRVVVRTWVDRVWRPSDYGSADRRELGIAVADWKFSGSPPPLSTNDPAESTEHPISPLVHHATVGQYYRAPFCFGIDTAAKNTKDERRVARWMQLERRIDRAHRQPALHDFAGARDQRFVGWHLDHRRRRAEARGHYLYDGDQERKA